MGRRLAGLPRSVKQGLLMATDVPLLFAVAWLAYAVRYGLHWTPTRTQIDMMVLAPVVAIPVFVQFGLYRSVLRHLPDRAVWTIAKAMAVTGLISVTLTFIANRAVGEIVPRSVPILYWALGTISVSLSRFAFKGLYLKLLGGSPRPQRILVYGAGTAGVHLAEALRAGGGHKVIGFIDENPKLHGHTVAGLPVFRPNALGNLIKKHGIEEIIHSAPSMSAAGRAELLAGLATYPVTVRMLPSITDLARGKYVVSQLQQIDIDELLGRSSVPADTRLLRTMIMDRTILVTGAGGSIGSELVRLIARWRPRRLILLEVNEFALYEIERELSGHGVHAVPVLGSVTDLGLLDALFAEHTVDVVLHAAANKHVPLLEDNACEAVRNNVLGTKCIAEAARDAGVERFVLVSTDKAVHPTSVMGATKRWAEYLIGHLDRLGPTRTGARTCFCGVRFGNVLGSRGSVVPLFKEQIANGGPVTVTDPGMSRYFMSIHEAAELIVQAGAVSEGGEIFVLDMGRPVRIMDLARQMITLSGMTVAAAESPNGDIAIEIIGMRRGEKLHEELFYDPAAVTPTLHPKILSARGGSEHPRDIMAAADRLIAAAERHDEAEVRRRLFAVVQSPADDDAALERPVGRDVAALEADRSVSA